MQGLGGIGIAVGIGDHGPIRAADAEQCSGVGLEMDAVDLPGHGPHLLHSVIAIVQAQDVAAVHPFRFQQLVRDQTVIVCTQNANFL